MAPTSLRLRLLAAFLVLVGLVLFVGVASFRINQDVRADVAELRASDVFDLRTVDLATVGIEVEGYWNPAGSVVATDIKIEESSPRPRLRGAIQALDHAGKTLTLFGRTIRIDEKTEDDDDKVLDFARLSVGMRVRASCLVEEGVWRARKVELVDVKNSDQINGQVTQKELDGVRPEWIEIHGLRIVLEPQPHDSPENALGRIGKGTQMFTALHDLKTGAHDLVEGGAGPEAAARLTRALERFQLVLQQAHGEAGDPLSAPPSGFIGPVLKMQKRQPDLVQMVAQLVELVPRDPGQARAVLERDLDPLVEQLGPSVSAYLSDAEDDLGDQLRGVLDRTATTTRIALVTSLVAVVVAFVLGFFVWRSIDQPIQALREAARNLGAGRLDTRITLDSHREFGELAEGFNKMASELASTTVSMESLASVFDSMAAALIVFDSEGQIVNVNRATCDLVGRTREELIGQTFDVLCRFSAGERIGPNVPARGSAGLSVEKVFVRKDGSEFPVSFSGAELRASGGPLSGYVCVAQDLSEQKKIQERLRESLSEKELLLREVHHRVKNNMQVISSLLAMQSTGGDEAVAKKLEDSQNRIRSIALIHEQLYRSTEIEHIGARAYLESLTSQLVQSFGVGNVALELDVDAALTLDIDQSMACGLIVNELVTNAVKYAFPDGRRGTIQVSLRERPGGERLLEVKDDGRGMEPSNGPSKSLGMSLIATLARQLRGRFELDGRHGTRVQVLFPRRDNTETRAT